MKKEILDEVLRVQSAFYDGEIDDEEKMELFARFLEDGTEFRQVVLLTALFVHPCVKLPEIHEKGIELVIRLQKMGLISWDLQQLRRIYPLEPFFKKLQFSNRMGSFMHRTDKGEVYCPIIAYTIVHDDVEAFTHFITLLNPDSSAEYMDLSLNSATPILDKGSWKMSLLDIFLDYGAMRCFSYLCSIGHTFTSKTPLLALHSCNEEQFKELGFEIVNTEEFYKEAILYRRLWVLKTPQFKNSEHRENIKLFLEEQNVYVERGTFPLFFNGYLTAAYQDYDIEDYNRHVQLCDIVYNEESTKEEIKAAMEKVPDFKVLQAAASKRPRLFDIYVQVATELVDEGKLKLAPFEGKEILPMTLQKRGYNCECKFAENSLEAKNCDEMEEEEIHPGYVNEFGFAILNDNAEAFSELLRDSEGELTKKFNPSSIEQWMLYSARLGSQRCFEIGLMNGLSITEWVVKESVAGGNKSTVQQCIAKVKDGTIEVNLPCVVMRILNFLDDTINHRRLEIVD